MAAGTGFGRRQILSVLGGAAAAAPLAARAQQATKAPRIGFLYPGLAAMAASRIAALREGLRESGYGDADRLEIIVRAADGDPARLASLAADLVAQKPDLIVAVSLTSIRAVQAASKTMPVVAHDLEGDPVALGLVASLARPGGSLTGMFADFPDIAMKWLELLKQAIPTLSSVVVLHDPTTSRTQLDAVEAAARLLNVKLSVVEASTRAELSRVFATAGERRPDAVVILTSPLFGTDPKLIAELALAQRLATASLFTELARAGGLIGYGPNLLGTFRQLGPLVGKVLHGMRPAELPVERPTKFEMVINLPTAKALGLTLPNSLLLRADEVIE